MNPWSLLYYTSFIFYVFSGIYVLRLNKKSIINIMFFLMCLALSLWSLGYAFTTGADTLESAQKWRILSTIGWSYFYSTMLIFFISIINRDWVRKNIKYSYLLYLPSTFFFIVFAFFDKGSIVKKSYGWVHVIYDRSIWSNIFDIYYLLSVLTGLAILLYWGRKSQSLREKKQVKVIVISIVLVLIAGGTTDTLLPILGVEILPLGVVLCTIVISGIWIAITKYKMMTLTQEIAAEHVLITMMDPVIVMSTDFVIGQVNKAAIDLTGYTSNELIGEKVNIIIDDLGLDSKMIRELSEIGFANGYEIELVSKNNNKTPCLCSGVCVKTDYGEKIGVILVLHDITRRRFHEELIKHVNENLKLKISKLNNVFDNVGQGILTFKYDLKIQDEYSLECEKIFKRKIESESFPHLLFPDNEQMQSFVTELLMNIFESDDNLRELYLPLLPDEVITHNRMIKIDYKFTQNQATEPIMMAFMTDITENKRLEDQMDQERKTLKMVIKALLNREDFIDLIDGYKTFASRDLSKEDESVEDLLRTIHTYKGNFSQYYMQNLIDHLHQLEEQLHSKNTIAGLIDKDELDRWLKHDLEIIESYVGQGFFTEGERFNVTNDQLIKIEEKITSVLKQDESNIVLPLIKDLRKKSFHELLNNYIDYTMKLSERLGKKIRPFKITGDMVYVDRKDYQDVIKSLIHIFRDCVDHGIETEDERIEKGKEAYGNISCEIKDSNEEILIIISDDGRGININELANKVVTEGLISREDFEMLSEDEKMSMIFKHRITTKTGANILSGRGVGLAAVEAAVIKSGGSISVTSELNRGIKFAISLPKKEVNEISIISHKDFLGDIVATTHDIICNKTGYDFIDKQVNYNNIIDLNDINVLIRIKGSINCIVGFSVDTYKAQILVGSMLLGNVSDEDYVEYMDDACGELVNTILGNMLQKYQDTKNVFEIGIPIVFRTGGGYLRYNHLANICYRLYYEEHYFDIYMLLEAEDSELEEYLSKGVV